MREHIDIRISGKVQGVSFRYYAVDKAEGLGIVGFVRNEPDGTVYIEAEGERALLDKFIEWCRHGPPEARVDHTGVSRGKPKNFKEFSIEKIEE